MLKKKDFLLEGDERFDDVAVKEHKGDTGKLLSHEKVPDSPFAIVEVDGLGCFVAMGNDRISDFMSPLECWELVNEKPWDLILSAVTSLVSHILIDKKLIEKP